MRTERRRVEVEEWRVSDTARVVVETEAVSRAHSSEGEAGLVGSGEQRSQVSSGSESVKGLCLATKVL